MPLLWLNEVFLYPSASGHRPPPRLGAILGHLGAIFDHRGPLEAQDSKNVQKPCVFIYVFVHPGTPPTAKYQQSWGHLGPILGPIGATMGLPLGYLGPPSGYLGPSWGHLGPSWRHLGAILNHLGANFGGILGHLVGLLTVSWPPGGNMGPL